MSWRDLEVDRMHFARMWPQRHSGAAFIRESIRDNVRSQRAARAHAAAQDAAAAKDRVPA